MLSSHHDYKILYSVKQQLIAQSKNIKITTTSIYRDLFKFVFDNDIELGNCNADVLTDKYPDIIPAFQGRYFI